MIPVADLSVTDLALRAEIESGMRAVFDSGRFVSGPNVAALEDEISAYLGVDHAIACASGTDALHLALRAFGLGPGDEVITSPFTFFATVEAILYVGARPVFADIDPRTFTLDPAAVEAAISPATRVVLPVHLFGQMADMKALLALARRHGLKVVEDCAQAFGARRDGILAGAAGDAACFSFFPSKNLGAFGDGGLIATPSKAIEQCLRELCNHGSAARYFHQRVGYNSRLDELQAVVVRAKLKRVDAYNEARRRIARQYTRALKDIPGITPPQEHPAAHHVYNQYTLLTPQRDLLQRTLQAHDIATAIHYPLPLHKQPALAEHYAHQKLPVAEMVAERCLSLPIYPELDSASVEQVLAALHATATTSDRATLP